MFCLFWAGTISEIKKNIMPTSSNKDCAIKVTELTKTYSINKDKKSSEVIYALNNVSFKINKGEIIGIIGSNGSGKSTLLKIISKITAPDSGTVLVKGKVASILEVGIGFNPDLCGRKNIYLNARLHGMKKAEVDTKFDEIVDLFGFPRFLDTPVKQYSSGMYMRLAFAIVVSLDADIYLFDEVLSVGDIKFQEASMKRIAELQKLGKTICIVTHNPSLIVELTNRMILLNKGKIIAIDTPERVILYYKETVLMLSEPEKYKTEADQNYIQKRKKYFSKPNGDFSLLNINICNNNKSSELISEDEHVISMLFKNYFNNPISIGIYLSDHASNQVVLSFINKEQTYNIDKPYSLEFIIPANYFNNITAHLGVVITAKNIVLLQYNNLLSFSIQSSNTQTKLKSAGGFINAHFTTNLHT